MVSVIMMLTLLVLLRVKALVTVIITEIKAVTATITAVETFSTLNPKPQTLKP